ncbi:MAG: hypothetical protein LJE70_15290 [Chromatiaceae bacterium]|nr:hypothetical protein [Chromatiaceae bacterium]
MVRQRRFLGWVLAATLTLGLPAQASEAEQEQETVKAAETQPSTDEAAAQVAETAPSNEMKTLDAVAVRPVTFISSVFSAGAFVLALPFAALDPAMNVETTRKNLVDYPFGETFKRPLGDFNGSAW